MEIGNLNLVTAYIGGLTAFFAPCLLPLLPSYFSVITGFTFKDLYGLDFDRIRARVFLSSIFFVTGFALIYSLFGASGSLIGKILHNQFNLLIRASGIFLIFLGLIQLGIIKFNFLEFDYAWQVQKKLARLGYLTAFLTGMTCALIWIPCIGQLLATILLLAANSNTAKEGMIMLFIFSLGLGTPFLLLGLFFPTVFKYLKNHQQFLIILSKSAGALVILFGGILLLNQYQFFITLFYKISALLQERISVK